MSPWTNEQLAAYTRDQRDARRRNGLCVECGKRPPKHGYLTCDHCLSSKAQRKAAIKAAPKPLRRTEVAKPFPTQPILRLGYCPPAGSLALAILGRDRA